MKTKHEDRDPAEFMRPTTLTLSPRHWDWLRAKEAATGVKPSVTARKVFDEAMATERRRAGVARGTPP